jgi:glycosyltransferase involved in cell wall biosynthesis
MAFFSRKRRIPQKPEPWISPEDRAASLLGIAIAENDGAYDDEITILDKDLQEKKLREQKVQETAQANKMAEQAIASAPRSERKKLRALVVTADVSLFSAGSAAEAEYATLADYFDELHIIVLTLRSGAKLKPRRIAPNVWVYPTVSRSPLFAIYDIYKIARKQLAFAAGFRADIVVSTDPFECGAAAYAVARRYDRPLQLQVLVNPFEVDYAAERDGNKWRLLAAKFLIPRADCILVRSEHIHEVLKKRYRDLADHIALLPPFHDLKSFKDATPAFDLHERYPQMKFIILTVSSFDGKSRTDLAIDACAPIIRQYPTIGLVIVGEGPLRHRSERKVAGMLLQNRIVFESQMNELVSYMKSSNLFLNVDTDETHDMYLAAASAAGLPVLTVEGNMASTLFTDNVNGFICPENDMVCLQARIGEFLNDNQLRASFALNARSQVFSTMEQDPEAYRRAYVDSFASCMLSHYSEDQIN